MSYDNRVNKFNGFFRSAFKDWPFTTWTAIILLLAALVCGFLWPGVGIVLAWVFGSIFALGTLIFVIIMICREFYDNL